MTATLKLPGRFIEDCIECDCDIGTYEKGRLTATPEQLAELRHRAEHYAHDGVDMAPPGLVPAAKRLLAAIAKATQP